MRPTLLPYAENPKPPFGSVSAVSTVNSPIVPVVGSMDVNLGSGFESPRLSFLSLVFRGGMAAGGTGVASGGADVSAFATDMEEADASSVFLWILLVFDFAALFAKPIDVSSKTSVSSTPTRKIIRIIPSDLRHQTRIHTNQGDTYPKSRLARNIQFFSALFAADSSPPVPI